MKEKFDDDIHWMNAANFYFIVKVAVNFYLIAKAAVNSYLRHSVVDDATSVSLNLLEHVM